MTDPMVWWGAVGFTVITIGVILSLFGRRNTRGATSSQPVSRTSLRTCPLCGSTLVSGEKVHSTVFATKTPDKIMEIAGCPHCAPGTANPKVRLCPVCKKPLRPLDVVTARVFERTDGRKTHVHVLGCPHCRKP